MIVGVLLSRKSPESQVDDNQDLEKNGFVVVIGNACKVFTVIATSAMLLFLKKRH